MEGGVEKIVSFSYLVYVIIGLAIGPAIEKLFEYVDIVVSYQETLNSLKAKVEDLTTIISLLRKLYPSGDIERQGSSAESAVKKWAVKLQDLHRDASAMEQNIARINVVSRYRASNEMKQKISEMEKHLKLFPLIQLELILRVLILTRRHPADNVPKLKWVTVCNEVSHPPDIVHKLATALIKRAAKSILGRMKMVIYFNRGVASLKDLVTSITPIVDEISRIRKEGAINGWFEKMRELDEKAEKIESLPWWNVIRRYKDTKDVANLISSIEAHVKAASLISLEPLFQVKMDLESSTPQKKLGPSAAVNRLEPLLQETMDLESSSLEPRFQEMVDLESSSPQEKLRPSAQVVETFIEVDASNDEGLRAPQEVEASTGEGLVMKWKPLHVSN